MVTKYPPSQPFKIDQNRYFFKKGLTFAKISAMITPTYQVGGIDWRRSYDETHLAMSALIF